MERAAASFATSRCSAVPTLCVTASSDTVRLRCRPTRAFADRILRNRLINPGPGQPPRAYGLDDRVDRSGDGRRKEDNVGSGLQGQHGGFPGTIAVRDCPHIERVRKEQTREAHLFSQELRHEFWREGRWRSVRAEDSGDGDMRGHHGVDPLVHRGLERNQLDAIQPSPVCRHFR